MRHSPTKARSRSDCRTERRGPPRWRGAVCVLRAAPTDGVAPRVEARGRIARGYRGLGLQPVKLDDGVGGMVMSVDKTGPSATAGIHQGDVIVGWNDQTLSSVRTLLH